MRAASISDPAVSAERAPAQEAMKSSNVTPSSSVSTSLRPG